MPDAQGISRMPSHSWFSRPFLACLVLLVATPAALRPGWSILEQRLQKESIALRKPFDQFDWSAMTSFRREPMSEEELVELAPTGADDAFLEQLIPKDSSLGTEPIKLFVTYYSDPQDKVPHTPDVCYRQGSTTIERLETITIETPELAPKTPRLDVRFLQLRQPEASGVILYLFYANGRPCYSRNQVRFVTYMPGDRYVYFSKIEAITSIPHDADPTQAIECCKRVLQEALPILISEHYPDDAQLR